MESRSSCVLPALGLFTWNLADNLILADDVYAGFYGFDRARVAQGVSIEEVIDRIVEADREEAARVTHRAILSGEFTTLEFRVTREGTTRRMICYGRCLRDATGTPSVFTGGVFESGTEFLQMMQSRQFCH